MMRLSLYRAVHFQATGRSKTRPLRRSAANVIGQRKPKPHKPLQPIRPLDSRPVGACGAWRGGGRNLTALYNAAGLSRVLGQRDAHDVADGVGAVVAAPRHHQIVATPAASLPSIILRPKPPPLRDPRDGMDAAALGVVAMRAEGGQRALGHSDALRFLALVWIAALPRAVSVGAVPPRHGTFTTRIGNRCARVARRIREGTVQNLGGLTLACGTKDGPIARPRRGLGVAARFAQNRTLTPINGQPGVPAASAASWRRSWSATRPRLACDARPVRIP